MITPVSRGADSSSSSSTTAASSSAPVNLLSTAYDSDNSDDAHMPLTSKSNASNGDGEPAVATRRTGWVDVAPVGSDDLDGEPLEPSAAAPSHSSASSAADAVAAAAVSAEDDVDGEPMGDDHVNSIPTPASATPVTAAITAAAATTNETDDIDGAPMDDIDGEPM